MERLGGVADLAKTTRIDSVAFTGRSGQEYEFRVYVWDTRFKSLPGVYVIASRSIEPGQPATYTPVFVGATDDLSKAMKSHPRSECFQVYYANVIGVLKQEDEGERDRVTADLIEGIAPPCNAEETDV
jgi:hypothetical protein